MHSQMKHHPAGDRVAVNNQAATFKLDESLSDSPELRASVTALMRPPAPAKARRLRLPTVSGRVLLDLRTDGLSAWEASEEAHRRVRAFWCRPGADVVVMVGAGLSPLPFLVDPISECEPGSVEVIGADDRTVGQWVRALRGTAVDGVSSTDPIDEGLHTLQADGFAVRQVAGDPRG